MNRKLKSPPPKAVRRAEWKARLARILGLVFCTVGFGAIRWDGPGRPASRAWIARFPT